MRLRRPGHRQAVMSDMGKLLSIRIFVSPPPSIWKVNWPYWIGGGWVVCDWALHLAIAFSGPR